ncbi:MAG: hypothetical protein R6V05_11020 [Candidatus Brocadiia bacterium]
MGDITLEKQDESTSLWRPLEPGRVEVADEQPAEVTIADAGGRIYVRRRTRAGRGVRFRARGTAGLHTVRALDADGQELSRATFRLQPCTHIECSGGPYAELARLLENEMTVRTRKRPFVVDGRLYNFLVSWGRDHTHVMKAMMYFIEDVKSGIEFFLERQRPNGMLWDDCHRNHNCPQPSWFCEALGEGYYGYSDDMAFTFRRIPVEADVEFLYTECVWYAWKASGDDAWMAEQLPKLEKALEYNAGHPTRWSEEHGLVKRSFCMDSWDFANPHFCAGDHRVIHPEDPMFLFHSDNSGLYASHWRMAEMHEAAGDPERAAELHRYGEQLRERANEKLFFGTNYGHMIPEKLAEEEVYALVGDERERMSLSTGYTINRGLPTHEMAVKILEEYRRRGEARREESFAEWWSMDPPYTYEQWPDKHCTIGHYMNGAIGVVVAGELARAAYGHGMEDYGTDILKRLWKLSRRDGGYLHSCYLRLPEDPPQPHAEFQHVDLRPFANVGLRCGAHEGVTAWTDEGENDMRNLPTGRRRFGAIEFEVIDPDENAGRAVVRLDPDPALGVNDITVPVDAVRAESLYFMHVLAHTAGRGEVAGVYTVCYADGTEERIYVRNGHEIGLWWGITDNPDLRRGNDPVDRSIARVAWQGPNGEWKNVGLFMTGWDNPHPEKPVTAVRLHARRAERAGGGIMLAAISAGDEPVKFEQPIRSGGWPVSWSLASVFYAIGEGLAGIEDEGRAFDRVKVSPRWAATESARNRVTMHYPASDGYCSYRYRLDEKKGRIVLDLTGSFESGRIHCLLPEGAQATGVSVGGEDVPFENVTVEDSAYVDFALDALPTGPINIDYSA